MIDKQTKTQDIKILRHIVTLLRKENAFYESMIKHNEEYLEDIERELSGAEEEFSDIEVESDLWQLKVGGLTHKWFAENGIKTINDLTKITREELLKRLPSLAAWNVRCIEEGLKERSLSLHRNSSVHELEPYSPTMMPFKTPHYGDEEYHGLSHIDALGLSPAMRDNLTNLGIFMVRDLIKLTKEELIALPNIGLATYYRVKDGLRTFGLRLKGDK